MPAENAGAGPRRRQKPGNYVAVAPRTHVETLKDPKINLT
jgi:hypothetical protein